MPQIQKKSKKSLRSFSYKVVVVLILTICFKRWYHTVITVLVIGASLKYCAMKRGENISTHTLNTLCKLLQCTVEGILEYVDDET